MARGGKYLKMVGCKISDEEEKILKQYLREIGKSQSEFLRELIHDAISQVDPGLTKVNHWGLSKIEKSNDSLKIENDAGEMVNHSVPEGFKSVIELEKEEMVNPQFEKDVEKLLKEVSPTGIVLKKWVEGQISRNNLIPTDESIKRVFPQLSEKGIKLVVQHYLYQGLFQKKDV